MRIEFGQIGMGGVVKDMRPHDLPPNIFTDSLNVEYVGWGIRPMRQDVQGLPSLPNGEAFAYLHQGWAFGSLLFWFAITKSNKFFVWHLNQWKDVTPSGLTASTQWDGLDYNGFLIVYSPENDPRYVALDDITAPPKVVPNWPSDLRTKKITTLNGFLIGLGITSSDGFYDRQIVFWSDVAELGSFPTNWDFTSPTSRAGFVPLEGSEDFITAKPLGNSILIYRDRSVTELRFVGGNNVFAFQRLLKNVAIFNERSVVEIDRQHFFVGKDGFFFYNGIEKVPVGDRVIKDHFYQNLNTSVDTPLMLQAEASTRLIFIYYVPKGQTTFTRVWILNLMSEAFYERELPSVGAAAFGMIPLPGELRTWSELPPSMVWNNWDEIWGLRYADDRASQVTWGGVSGVRVLPNEGQPMPCYATRLHLAFAETDQAGMPTVNRAMRKMISQCWPEMDLGSLTINFGTSESVGAPVQWKSPKAISSTEVRLHQSWAVSGKYISISFTNMVGGQPADFVLTGYAVDVRNTGVY